jgi:hypothetical protein
MPVMRGKDKFGKYYKTLTGGVTAKNRAMKQGKAIWVSRK